MPDLLARWTSEAWVSEVDAWVGEVLGARGTPATGAGEAVKTRFWSVVRRYPTTGGPVWFKECNPGQAFEGPLLAALAGLEPDAFPLPIALDGDRVLLPDAGKVRPRDDRVLPASELESLLVRFAELQRRLAAHREALVGAGLPTLTAADVPGWVEQLADELAALPVDHPQHLDPGRARQVRRGLPRVRDWSGTLAGSSVPDSLQHDDLNPGNVATDGGRLRFLDVGDAFWSHPFAVVQVPLAMWTRTWPWGPDLSDPAVEAVLEAYLQQWTTPGRPLGELRLLAEPARLLAQVHRCESWRRLLAPVPPDRLGIEPPLLSAYLLHVTQAPAAGR